MLLNHVNILFWISQYNFFIVSFILFSPSSLFHDFVWPFLVCIRATTRSFFIIIIISLTHSKINCTAHSILLFLSCSSENLYYSYEKKWWEEEVIWKCPSFIFITIKMYVSKHSQFKRSREEFHFWNCLMRLFFIQFFVVGIYVQNNNYMNKWSECDEKKGN